MWRFRTRTRTRTRPRILKTPPRPVAHGRGGALDSRTRRENAVTASQVGSSNGSDSVTSVGGWPLRSGGSASGDAPPVPAGTGRSGQLPVEHRASLRSSAPGWGVLLDHRHRGRLLNVSCTGLAVEVRQSPSFRAHSRLRISGCPKLADVELSVRVVWCRLVGLEEVAPGETEPRFWVGLECRDERVLKALATSSSG